MAATIMRAKPETLAQLLEELSKDSEEALAKLIHFLRPQLYTSFRFYTADQQLIEELFMDLMQTIWEHRKELPGLAYPAAWLLRVARNKSLNALRRRKQQPVTPIEWANAIPDATATHHAVELSQLRYFIYHAVQHLTPAEQQVVQLRIREGLNTKEIAHRLNVSESTIRTQLSSSLKKIRLTLSGLLKQMFV